ncbi:hypothetical protein C8J56DRAFT_1121938 [Mycena floridula]|nr:hypothetical protein C8J56DRAFT_1121938 [Mycena floridula]
MTNAVAQFAAIFGMLRVPRENGRECLTDVVAKMNASAAVMSLWKTWGVLDKITVPPAPHAQFNTAIIFLLLTISSGPNPTLGLGLLYVLLSLFLGDHQNEYWHMSQNLKLDNQS